MAAMTIRNLPDETHRAIKMRAKLNKRSAEAEVRAILDEAVNPPVGLKIGTELAKFGKLLGGRELKIVRDKTPAGSTVSFE
jgi:plasmid stability protein